MHLDPNIPIIVATMLGLMVLVLIFRRLNQPQVLAYILAGVFLGPFGIDLLKDMHTVQQMGDFGVLLLLFFLGMEISISHLLSNWRVTVIGTLIQILISLAVVWGFGYFFAWPLARVVLLGFALSLSSTAMIIPLLQHNREINTPVGRDVVGVLLVQDMALVPMIIILGFMGDEVFSAGQIALQIVGAVLILALMVILARGKEIHLPFARQIRADHELQVFSSFAICFGMALITYLLGLSTVIGAFVAGMIVAHAKETSWARKALEPFHVLLVAMFFISIGMLLDLDFIRLNYLLLLLVGGLAMGVKIAMNFLISQIMRRPWRESLYGASLLGQVGEFSFILAAIGLKQGLFTDFGYQTVISIIAMSILISPLLTDLVKRLARIEALPQS